MHSLRASPVFALTVLVTLGLAGLFGLMTALMALRLGFLLPGPFAQMAHFTDVQHRIHDFTFGFLFVPAVVGMLAQLRRPSKNVAGQLMALIPSVSLALTLVLTFVLNSNASVLQPPWIAVGVTALLAATLHPAGRDFFRSFSVARINLVMLALVIVAAGPLLIYGSTNIGRQTSGADAHAVMGHFGFMAAFSFTVIGVGVLASLRPDGWRLTAWVAGLLPALLGFTSMVFPDFASSLGPFWALAAIAWGVVFVAAAELARRPTESTGDASVAPDRGSTAGTPRLVYVVGIVVIAVVLLFVIQHLIGGGLGGLHAPPAPGP